MIIIDFNHSHIEMAMNIAMDNYEEARKLLPILPKVEAVPDLTHFADNQLGVAAFEDNKMLGYLCAYYPREDVFGTTNVKGTFSPLHAHGVVCKPGEGVNRNQIYSRLYQGAAEKWVREGIVSHGIALYTHDKVSINSFFYNGFGLRCIDAISALEDIPSITNTQQNNKAEFVYCEVPREDWRHLLEHHNELILHLGSSPTFMKYDKIDEEELYGRTSKDVRYFAIKSEGKYIAYVKISDGGENFVTEDSSMMNICGAYCEPNYRGNGNYFNLISYLAATLKEEGYRLLGVDCESFNPTARGFWLKHFKEYTHSVVRRIDDKAIQKNIKIGGMKNEL